MQRQEDLWASELYESTLRQRLLPVRLAPQDGESLSSWIVRLADAHAMSVQALSAWLMGRGRQAFGEDVDRGAWHELLEALVSCTGVEPAGAHETTLKSLEGALWGSIATNGPARWVLPIGKVGTHRTRYGVQFCAACLSTDEKPYLRLRWRLAFHVCCPVHHCLLSDRCGHCAAPVAAHRWRTGQMQRLGTSGIVFCHACGADRREVSRTYPIPIELEQAQSQMDTAMEQGSSQAMGIQLHGLPFFAGAAVLWSMLDEPRVLLRLQAAFGLPAPPMDSEAHHRYGGFEKKDVSYRAWLLACWSRLIVDGVDALFETLRSSGLRSEDISRFGVLSRAPVPYWVWRATRDHLDYSFYVPSSEEIFNAINYQLKCNDGKYARVGEVCELLGMRTRHSSRVARLMRSRGVIARAPSSSAT